MRLAGAAALYCAIVFGVGFLLGPLRVLWLEPRLGKTLAILCETPFLLAAMVVAARWVPRKVGLRGGPASLAAMGAGALVLQQVADFAVGVALRGMTPGELVANFGTPAGLVYAAALLAFAAMPALVNRDRMTR
ncbi:MAG: hypothetical protein ACLQE9_23125 [Roseiarcus sp.]